ncbi:MAG: hypothetical protein U9Q99_01155 [Nanoarchaeota archaeon]|nr:hypothetical protein [Nanoarchaeota archaeon]
MELVKERKIDSKKKKKIIISSSIFVGIFLIFFLGIVLNNVGFSGQVVLTEDEVLEFQESTSYVFMPEEKGEIKSIKITGKIVGDGEAQVYFQDRLVFTSIKDSDFAAITGNVIEGSNQTEVNQTEVNQTEVNQTEVNETEVNETEVNETEVNETEVNETEVNETEVNETVETIIIEDDIISEPVMEETTPEKVIEEEIVIDESIQNIFVDECKETCKLEDIQISEEYFLEILLEGNVKLIIYEIEYEIVPFIEEEINFSK